MGFFLVLLSYHTLTVTILYHLVSFTCYSQIMAWVSFLFWRIALALRFPSTGVTYWWFRFLKAFLALTLRVVGNGVRRPSSRVW